jgi:hypothetical protein
MKHAKLLNKGHAEFEKKPVYGKDRFYPKNELADKLVNFKQAAAQQNRKRFIKCLAQREIDAAQEMGIIVIVR